MTHAEYNTMLEKKASYVTEREISITPSEYLDLERQMINQGAKDKVHILSMSYNCFTEECKIKRRYFS